MREVEKTGRTVEEAVEAALEELGITRDKAEIEVLDEGARGFLGLLKTREARVRVTWRPSKGEFAADFIRQVGDFLEIPLKVVWQEKDGIINVDIDGEGLGILIGRRGQTLAALQYLTNAASRRIAGDGSRVVLDVQGYKNKRGESLERLAARAAERAIRYGREVSLDPMPATDRRIVHMALKDNPRVKTHSRGEEPYRKVVVAPVK